MKCPKCDSEKIRAFIDIQLYIDAKDNGHLTKAMITKRSTRLWSQNHSKTSYVCSDCGYAWGSGYNGGKK